MLSATTALTNGAASLDGSFAPNGPSRENLKILIGPSYLELGAVEGMEWRGATLRYLKKYRQREQQEEWKQEAVEDLRKHKKGVQAESEFIYYDAASIGSCISRQSIDKELAKLICRLNEDISCLLMAERERSNFFGGTLLAPIHVANCARYAWSVLKNYRPDLIVFHNLPHEVFTYILLQLALHLNIPTLLVHYSVLPWRMCISTYSKDGAKRRVRINEDLSGAERASVRTYMERLQGSHERAIPAVNAPFISAGRSALYFGDELRSALKGQVLKSAVRIVNKWSLYRAFKSFVRDEVKRPYVVFLMHYQPEETTIPRGGIYSQQLNAILRLRSMLPAQISILVKENKATFRWPLTLAMGVRSHDFYAAIASLPDTYLVDIERDTFNLVDNSLAVATITGSVGVEALCRGKKVIVFGDANYSSFSGVIRLHAIEPGDCDLSALIDGSGHDPALTEGDLLDESRCSIGPAVESNEANFRSQQTATLEAFQYLSRNLEQLLSSR